MKTFFENPQNKNKSNDETRNQILKAMNAERSILDVLDDPEIVSLYIRNDKDLNK